MDWLFHPIFRISDKPVTPVGIAAFAFFVALGFVLSTVIQGEKARRLANRLGLDKKIVNFATNLAGLVVLLSCVLVGLGFAGLPIRWDSNVPGTSTPLSKLLWLVAASIFIFWLSAFTKRVLFNRYLSQMGTDRALQYAIAQIASYVVLIVGVLIVLQNGGVDLSPLAVFAGAAGVGLGFGLQNIARNFISGLVILAERPIKIGDRIEVNHVAGRVTEIRARSTTVLTNDNIAIIVPNSEFIEKPVINWSHGDPQVRFRVPVGVAYGSDVEKVCALLLEIAREHPSALRDPQPVVYFDSFGESTMNFELGVFTLDMSHRPRRFRSDLNFAIEKKFREAGIEIPPPQREVRVSGELAMRRPASDKKTEAAEEHGRHAVESGTDE